MMIPNLNSGLIRWTVILSLMVVMLFPSSDVTGQDRGQGVRIKAEGGQTIDLYEGSYALVIGAVNYRNWRPLPGVRNDVEEVTAVLQQHGFSVETLVDPTRESFDRAMRRFISDFGQATNNRLLIYFAGHGHTLTTSDKRNLGYIVPVDAPAAGSGTFKRYGIGMDEIAEVIAKQIESKHVLFVFDSCFSGSIFATRSPGMVPPSITMNVAEPVRQFITAGSENEEVPDRSIFREYLVKGLEGGADSDKDGYITGSELGLYLEQKVTNDPHSSQKPQWGKISSRALNRGDFVFRVPSGTSVRVAVNPRPRVEQLLQEAERALLLHNYPKMATAAGEALKLDPDNVIAHGFRLAEYAEQSKYEDIKNDPKVRQQAKLIVELFKKKPPASSLPPNIQARSLEARAEAYEYLGMADLAAKYYEDAIANDPSFTLAYLARAGFYLEQKKMELALEDTQSAIRLNPNIPRAYSTRGFVHIELGNFDEAIKDFTRSLNQATDQKFVYYNYVGRGAAYLGKLELVKQSSDLNANTTLSPSQIGLAMDAERDLTKAIELNPNNQYRHLSNVYFVRASLSLLQEDTISAMNDLSKAIELNPKDPKAYKVRAVMFLRRSDAVSAINDLSKAIELNPKDDSSYSDRAKLLLLQKDYQSAMNDANKAIQLNPKNSHAYTIRASLSFSRQDYLSAMDDANKAIQLDSKETEAYAMRAILFHFQNDNLSSMNNINKAIQLAPNIGDYYHIRADIHRRMGRYDLAELDEQKARSLAK